MSDGDPDGWLEHLHRTSPCDFSDGASLGFFTALWLYSGRSIPRKLMKVLSPFMTLPFKEHSGTTAVVTKSAKYQGKGHRPHLSIGGVSNHHVRGVFYQEILK